MDDDTVFRAAVSLEQREKIVALLIGKVLLLKKRITECQARGYSVFFHEIGDIAGIRLAETDTAAAP